MNSNSNSVTGSSGRGLQVVGLLALIIGIVGLYPLLTQGGKAFNQGSALAWGLPVVTYAFLALASFGVSIVSMLGVISGQAGMHQLVRRNLLLALSLSLGAILALALELGHPFRALWAIPLNLQLRSPLLWMGVCWAAYLLCLLAALLLMRRDGRRAALTEGLSLMILLTALSGLVTQGLVYGMMAMRPVWFGFATPLYFLIGSLPLGLALISLFSRLTDGGRMERLSAARRHFEQSLLPRLLLAALVLYIITWLARLTTGLWTVQDGHHQVFVHMLGSPLFYLELLVGLLLPLLLLLSPARGQPLVSVITALCIIGGLFIARYEFVIGGQLVPLFKGSWMPDLITYVPSLTEWMVTLTGFALVVTLYSFGRAWLFGGRDADEASA